MDTNIFIGLCISVGIYFASHQVIKMRVDEKNPKKNTYNAVATLVSILIGLAYLIIRTKKINIPLLNNTKNISVEKFMEKIVDQAEHVSVNPVMLNDDDIHTKFNAFDNFYIQ